MRTALSLTVALVAFSAPALANSSNDGTPTPMPHRVCKLRTDTQCQVPSSEPDETRYRVIKDGLFCTERWVDEDGTWSIFIHCNPWWPAKNPVINARLKPKPTPRQW